jgi:poly(3-hydroxybutyrate) depolymerase
VRIAIACLVAWTSVAHAAPAAPCKRCTLELPAHHDAAMPLLVVLHGDRERATSAAARWHAAAAQRGWVLLALQCPVDQGCKDSWWQWNGDPSWIADQVTAVAKITSIDPDRVYLAGWSGGATYIGMHAPAWATTFAALVIHGGGHAPDAECPTRPLPAYFLVGDQNPLHYLMKNLRSWFDGCHEDIVWDLVRGGDHDKEDRALDRKKALSILDWLAERTRAVAK